jgi:WD40 repeat protein
VPGSGTEPTPASAADGEAHPPLLRFGEARLRHIAPVSSLALCADGTKLLTATEEEPVLRLWDVKTGRLLRAVRVTDKLTASLAVVALAPDGRTAFVIRLQKKRWVNPQREPALIDLTTGAVVRWPLEHKFVDPHPAFALSPDGKTIAGIIGDEIRAWECTSGTDRVLGTIPDPNELTGGICFSPDGSHIAAGRSRGAFFVAALNGNAPLRRIPVTSNDNDVLAVFWPRADRVVALWSLRMAAFDPTTGAELARSDPFDERLDPPGPRAGGVTLFARENASAWFTSFNLSTLSRRPGRVSVPSRNQPFAVSADGRVLAVATGHAVRLFDARTEEPLHPELERAPFEPLVRLRLTPDGSRLAGCTARTAHDWALSDWRALKALEGTWDVPRFVLSPDGRYQVGTIDDRDGETELCVWETVTWAEVYRFRPARGATAGAFTPDGRGLVVAHTDTTLSVWDRAGLEARQCGSVPVSEEWQALGSRSARQARAATLALVADPKRALAVLGAGFELPTARVTSQLLAELGSEDFRVRERAHRALAALGIRAEAALLTAVAKSDSPEVRLRAAALLNALWPIDGRHKEGGLRAVRAVEVLEAIGSPQARALLATWVKTYPNSALAAEAHSALARLAKKSL